MPRSFCISHCANEMTGSREAHLPDASNRSVVDHSVLEDGMGNRLRTVFGIMRGKETTMANANLSAAKKDEFYTQYADIAREMEAYLDYDANAFRGKTVLLPCDDPEWSNFTRYFAENFERIGLKKLISTSYAFDAKKISVAYLPGFESLTAEVIRASPKFDRKKERQRGKIFVLDEDTNRSGRIDLADLKWDYLNGDGDFRSDEVKALRDEADIIVTNPPFSLFREFLAWILAAKNAKDAKERDTKKFAIIGNQNAIKYKEVFPLIRTGRMWLGKGFPGGAGHFISQYEDIATAGDHRAGMIRVSGVVWFTNLEHGRRHTPLNLMTLRDNVKYSKHKEIKGVGYRKYVNFDAIEVPYTDAIPADFDGVMGVPITFLDKYCPEQFEILGSSLELAKPMAQFAVEGTYQAGGPCLYLEEANGPYAYRRLYDRLLIRAGRG